MEVAKKEVKGGSLNINGFSPVSTAPVFWKSRKRSVGMKDVDQTVDHLTADKFMEKQQASSAVNVPDTDKKPGKEKQREYFVEGKQQESNANSILSEKRKALFEPLEPLLNVNGQRPSAESLLPPPDFESATYPRGWLIGKKRKLVNVDVVESMRRIAVQEMNRKDREIDGLNEQLEEDARCVERLQLQLLEERSKRADAERQNAMLQNQMTLLTDMLQENEAMDDEAADLGP